MRPPLTRVAVAQIDVQPAALVEGRSPLEDLLFDVVHDDSLFADGVHTPPELREEHLALKQRIRATYCRQLEIKLEAIVAACRGWGVRVLVLPEYSVPWELLPGLAKAAGDMVVVAGTHAVEPEGRSHRVYEALGWPEDRLPREGSAVATVLFRGRIVGLSAKLVRSKWEPDLIEGTSWAPVEIEGFGPTLGVMICIDFLARELASHRKLVAPSLDRARLLVVPSFTPPHSTERFAHKAAEEARHYKRPVLYADVASGGGTSIFADDRSLDRLAAFPLAPGVLPVGDEGIIVADVDLDLVAPGPSTSYDGRKVIEPVAQASLVYHCHPEDHRYAEWVTVIGGELENAGDDVARVRAVIGEHIEAMQSAGGLIGAKARGARLEQLWLRLGKLTQREAIARYTREVVLPVEALPLRHLRLALAQGVEKVVFEWARRPDAAGFAAVAQRMKAAARAVRFDDGTWTDEGRAAFEGVKRAIAVSGSEAGESERKAEIRTREVVPYRVPLYVLRDIGLADGRSLELARTPSELLSRFSEKDARDGIGQAVYEAPDGKLWAGDLAREVHGGERRGYLAWTVEEHNRIEDLHRVLVAEGNRDVSVAAVRREGGVAALLAIAADERGSRVIYGPASEWLREHAAMLCAAIDAGCDGKTTSTLVDDTELASRVEALCSRFDGARVQVEQRREQLLAEVNGAFIPPRVDRARRLHGRDPETLEDVDALEHLGFWAAAKGIVPGLLLHGEFGSGKSTLVAEWALQSWEAGRPVLLVPLLGLGDSDLHAKMLASAALDDTPDNRAALDLLVDRGLLVVCFDGFDEMIRDLTFDGIEARLRGLFAVGGQRSKIVVSSRSNYFRSPAELEGIADRVGRAVGFSDLVLMRVRPFSRPQVEDLVAAVRPEAVDATLAKIDRIYDLGDLSHSPLLLGMIVQTIDQLPEDARIGPAHIYEAYLDRWLGQTKYELFSPEQKKAFAELLADELWRSGAESCTWEALERSVYRRLVPDALPGSVPKESAALEIRGGAFFVHEGDRFRFAHRSFLEFFLARALMRLIEQDPERMLDTRPFSPEVLDFVGELLRHGSATVDAASHPVIVAVQTWLHARGGVPEEDARASARAAANALRLLAGVAVRLGQPRGWVPSGAGLQHVVLVGETLGARTGEDIGERTSEATALSLVSARFDHADLVGARLQGVDLGGSTLRAAKLCGAELHRVTLSAAVLDDADLTAAAVDGANLDGASLVRAKLRGSTWTHCSWRDVDMSEAEVGGWISPDAPAGVSQGIPRDLWVAIRRGHGGFVNALAWSTQGDRLASAGSDSTVRIWEPSSAKLLAQLDGHSRAVNALAWSAQGDRLASAGYDGIIRIWASTSAELLAQLDGHSGSVNALVWSARGDCLASAGDDGTARIWEATSAKLLAQLNDHSGSVSALAWSVQGNRLASAGYDRTVRIWEPSAAKLIARLDGHLGWVRALAWSAQGDRLASAGEDRSICIWDATSTKLLTQSVGQTAIRALAWSAEGNRLASGGGDGSIRIWEPTSTKLLARLDDHSGLILALTWSNQGDYLASASHDGSICIWAFSSTKLLARLDAYDGMIRALAWSTRGDRLASAGSDGSIRIWDPSSAKLLAQLEGHKGTIWALAWSDLGDRLASAGDDRIVRIWEASSAKLITQLDGHSRSVSALAWSAQGDRLASAGHDQTICIWEPTSAALLARLDGHDGVTWALAWSAQGDRLASAGHDGSIRIWEPTSAKPLGRFDDHSGLVRALAWSVRGDRLASAGYDSSVRIWEPSSATLLARLDDHSGTVRALAWSSQGDRLASAGDDSSVRIWELSSAELLARLDGHSGMVLALAWSASSDRLASAGYDNTVCIWHDLQHIATLSAVANTHLVALSGGAFVASSPPPPLMLEARRPHARICLPLGSLERELHCPELVTATLTYPTDPLPAAIEQVATENHWPIDPDWSSAPRILPSRPLSQPSPPPPTALLTTPNPFRPNKSLDGLTPPPGRTDVLRRLLDHTQEGGSAALLGPRRAGKTSLFAYLRHHPTGPLFHASLQGITDPEITPDIIATTLDPSLLTHPHPARAFRDALQATPHPVILLDELGYLTRATFSALGFVRELSEDVASIVYAGTHGDWNAVMDHTSRMPGSSFGNNIYPIDLGPLAPDDATAFLTTTAPPNVPLARAAPWVVELTEGWPFYLQVMGYALVDEVRQHRYGALQERSELARLYEHAVLQGQSHVLRARWAELPPDVQRIVLREVTQPTVVTPRDLFPYQDLRSPERIRLSRVGIGHPDRGWRIDRPFLEWIRRNARDFNLEEPR